MKAWRMLLAASLVCVLAACDAKGDCLDQGGSYNEATKQCEK